MPGQRRLGRPAVTLLIALVLSLAFPAVPLSADHSLDEAIDGGRFYKQANGFGGWGERGYAIWDGPDGENFYSAFRRFGGVKTLGYPASRRYEVDGFIYLVTQGALLQYHPGLQRIFLANTFEILERAGLNDLLLARGIPDSIADDGSGGDFAKARATRLGWLTHDAIKRRYLRAGGENAAIARYGLPMSQPQAFGPFIAQRFQRITLQYWTEDVPGIARRGDVTTVLGGDLLKEFVLLPLEALAPHRSDERPPPVAGGAAHRESRFSHVLGVGESVFTGSPAVRVHNMALAAAKLDGAVIPAGAAFSVLDALGPITEDAGYQKSLIIWGDQTIEGIGGGVCQVSTTLFRAAFWAGLPITERNQHTYRLQYYEMDGSPPGFDAAVFNPGLDLKFVNDSEHSILIQARFNERNATLAFILRGADLNRAVEMLPVVEKNETAPGPPLPDRPDPNLPLGVRKQVEWAAVGLVTGIKRKVVADGATRIDEFWSDFAPWREQWAVGTGAAE